MSGVALPPAEPPAAQPAAAARQSEVRPLAYPLATAIIISGISRSSLYRAIKAGDVQAVKAGRSTLILAESLCAYITGLPPAVLAPSREAA